MSFPLSLNSNRQGSHRTLVPTWLTGIRTEWQNKVLVDMLPDSGNMGVALNVNSEDPENMLYPVKTYDDVLLEASVCSLPFMPPNLEYYIPPPFAPTTGCLRVYDVKVNCPKLAGEKTLFTDAYRWRWVLVLAVYASACHTESIHHKGKYLQVIGNHHQVGEMLLCAIFDMRKSMKEKSKILIPGHQSWKPYEIRFCKKIAKDRSMKSEMKNILKTMKSGDCQNLNPPDYLVKLAMRVSDDCTANGKHIDELFSNGGGIHYHSNDDSTGFLLKSFGHNMNKLVLTPVKENTESPHLVPNSELSCSQTFANKIHQIVTHQGHEKILCAVRFAGALGVGFLDSNAEKDQEFFCVQEMKDAKQATDVCFSPYIPGEYVYVSSDGMFSIGNVETKSLVCNERIAPSAQIKDEKWSCKFSTTPRTLMLASGRHFILKDLRVGWRSTKNLFFPDYHLFYKKEKIRSVTASLVSPYLHYVASDYQLTLFDSRYPKTPVLVWQHQLQGMPTYCQPARYKTTSSYMYEAIVLASRQSKKVAMFSTQHVGQTETISLAPTVHLSTPTDFVDALVYKGQLVNLLIIPRTSAQLQGLQCVSTGQGRLTVLQQTECGDVFYQDLLETHFDHDFRPKNLGRCFHPQLMPFTLDESNTELAMSWIRQTLEPIFSEKATGNHGFKKRVLAINIMNDMMGWQRYLDDDFNVKIGAAAPPEEPPETECMPVEQLERIADEQGLITACQAPSFGKGQFDVDIDVPVTASLDALKNTEDVLMKSMLNNWDLEEEEDDENLGEPSVLSRSATRKDVNAAVGLWASSNLARPPNSSISMSQEFAVPAAYGVDIQRRPARSIATFSQDSLFDLQARSQTLSEIIPSSQPLGGMSVVSMRSAGSVAAFRNKPKQTSHSVVGF